MIYGRINKQLGDGWLRKDSTKTIEWINSIQNPQERFKVQKSMITQLTASSDGFQVASKMLTTINNPQERIEFASSIAHWGVQRNGKLTADLIQALTETEQKIVLEKTPRLRIYLK